MMEQIKEWKACETRAACAWKYATKAQQEVCDMRAREHDNQQPLIAKRNIQLLLANASKLYWAVALDLVGKWCSLSTIQSWLASFKSYSIHLPVERVI
jgi:hypothetical protein